MEEIGILPYRREMAAALWQIEQACFTDPWGEEAFRAVADTPGQIFFAAHDAATDRLVGFGGLWHIWEEGDLLNLAVLPAYRRRGIGRALLQALCAYADSHGIMTLYLEVRRSNAAAIALYRAFGFVPYGTRAAYYRKPREDAVLMRRETSSGANGRPDDGCDDGCEERIRL